MGAVVETNGLMAAFNDCPGDGMDIFAAAHPISVTFSSQPKGDLTIKNLTSGVTKKISLSSVSYGADVYLKSSDDPSLAETDLIEVEFAGKADNLTVAVVAGTGVLMFNGSGHAKISGLKAGVAF